MPGLDYINMAKDILTNKNWKTHNNAIFDHTNLSFNNILLKDLEAIRKFHICNEQAIGYGKTAIILKKGLKMRWEEIWGQGKKIISNNIIKLFENDKEAFEWISSSI